MNLFKERMALLGENPVTRKVTVVKNAIKVLAFSANECGTIKRNQLATRRRMIKKLRPLLVR